MTAKFSSDHMPAVNRDSVEGNIDSWTSCFVEKYDIFGTEQVTNFVNAAWSLFYKKKKWLGVPTSRVRLYSAPTSSGVMSQNILGGAIFARERSD